MTQPGHRELEPATSRTQQTSDKTCGNNGKLRSQPGIINAYEEAANQSRATRESTANQSQLNCEPASTTSNHAQANRESTASQQEATPAERNTTEQQRTIATNHVKPDTEQPGTNSKPAIPTRSAEEARRDANREPTGVEPAATQPQRPCGTSGEAGETGESTAQGPDEPAAKREG